MLHVASHDVAGWLRPAILLALHTGLRQGELLHLRWLDVDQFVGSLSVEASKKNDKRRVPLNAAAREVIEALPRYGEWVISWPWGERVAKTTLYAAFRRSCGAAGLDDVRWCAPSRSPAPHAPS